MAATRPRVHSSVCDIPGVWWTTRCVAAPRFRVHAYSAYGLPTVYKSGRGETTGFRILATLDPRIGWWTRRLRFETGKGQREEGTRHPCFLPPAPLVFFDFNFREYLAKALSSLERDQVSCGSLELSRVVLPNFSSLDWNSNRSFFR